jgi:acyl carrier protein
MSFENSTLNRDIKVPNDAVFHKLRAIIIDMLGVEEWEVILEADLCNDLGCDEVDHLELMIAIAKGFETGFTRNEEKSIRTVGDYYRILKGRERYISLAPFKKQQINKTNYSSPKSNVSYVETSSQGNKSYLTIAAVIAALVIGYFVFGNKDDNKESVATAPMEQTAAEENAAQTVAADEPVRQYEAQPKKATAASTSTTSSVSTQSTSSQTVSEQTATPVAAMSDAELVAHGKKAMRAMDYDTAKRDFSQAASHGSTEATYQLGMLYSNNNFDGYSRETAASYFVRAARNNHVDAMYQAGMMYLGIDNSTARYWLEKAAANGHSRAEAQLSKIE